MQELVKALAAARLEFASVVKAKAAQAFKGGGGYKYADLAGVLDAVSEPLAKHGLVIVQPTEVVDGQTFLVTRLMHTSGDELVSRIGLHDFANGMKPQEWGSAHTYARRYQSLSILGIAPEDDDAAEAMKATPQPRITDRERAATYERAKRVEQSSPQREVEETLAQTETAEKPDMFKTVTLRGRNGSSLKTNYLNEAVTYYFTEKRASSDPKRYAIEHYEHLVTIRDAMKDTLAAMPNNGAGSKMQEAYIKIVNDIVAGEAVGTDLEAAE